MQSTVQLWNTGSIFCGENGTNENTVHSTYTLTLSFGGTWRAGWITTAKLSFVPYKPLFTSSSRRSFCWETIHKHCWGFVTQGTCLQFQYLKCYMKNCLLQHPLKWALNCNALVATSIAQSRNTFSHNNYCTAIKTFLHMFISEGVNFY